MIQAILTEIDLRKSDWQEFTFESIYFGGGTPSILTEKEISSILHRLHSHFTFKENIELTLEANPDDINTSIVKTWKSLGINRLSIGLQSLNNEELLFMNRSHTAEESLTAVEISLQAGIDNINVDLIYGSHLKTNEQWETELKWAMNSGANHLSAYALTVENKTVLEHRIKQGLIPEMNDSHQSKQFRYLASYAARKEWDFYEISNLCKPGHQAVHNSNYWHNKPYLGLGPSAHGFKEKTRYWNVSQNAQYIKQLDKGEIPQTFESLGNLDLANETILTQLRLSTGLNAQSILAMYPEWEQVNHRKLQEMIEKQWISMENQVIKLTTEGRLLADHISSELFVS